MKGRPKSETTLYPMLVSTPGIEMKKVYPNNCVSSQHGGCPSSVVFCLRYIYIYVCIYCISIQALSAMMCSASFTAASSVSWVGAGGPWSRGTGPAQALGNLVGEPSFARKARLSLFEKRSQVGGRTSRAQSGRSGLQKDRSDYADDGKYNEGHVGGVEHHIPRVHLVDHLGPVTGTTHVCNQLATNLLIACPTRKRIVSNK